MLDLGAPYTNEDLDDVFISDNLPTQVFEHLFKLGFNPETILYKAIMLSFLGGSGELYKNKQIELISIAIKYGADFSKSWYSSISDYFLLKKLFEAKIISADELLKACLQTSNLYYDYTSREYKTNLEKLSLQKELVELAISNNAIVQDASIRKDIDTAILETFVKEIESLPNALDISSIKLLLDKGLNPNFVLKTVFNKLNGTPHNEAIIEMINLTFSYKADIKHLEDLPFTISNEVLNILLNNGYDKDQALKKLLQRYEYNIEGKEAKLKNIQFLLEKGADINKLTKSRLHIELEELVFYKNTFLNHSTNPISIDNFLKLALSQYVMTYSEGKETLDPAKVEIQKKLVDEALSRGANINNIIENDIIQHLHIRIQNIEYIKDSLFNCQNPIKADYFLSLVVSSEWEHSYSFDDLESVLVKKLIEEAISKGANVNYELNNKYFIQTPLDIATSTETINLLKSHGAKCGPESDRALAFMQQEDLTSLIFTLPKTAKQIQQNLYADPSENNKIPYNLNYIWLTHLSFPREVHSLDIDTILQNKKFFENSKQNWKHIIWTNNKSLIPNSVVEFEKEGVEIREIGEIKDQLILFSQINEFINKKQWGVASDILRYSLIEQLGGVYADVNFKFNRNIESELYKYDYFSQNAINNFFAAKPYHPILSTLMNIVERNIINPPSYINSLDEKAEFTKTVFVSLLPFSLAFLRAANLEGNIDMLYPKSSHNNDDSKNWLEGDHCPYWEEVSSFPNYLGMCSAHDLVIGDDGNHGRHMTCIEE
jgi:hypothetical protein